MCSVLPCTRTSTFLVRFKVGWDNGLYVHVTLKTDIRYTCNVSGSITVHVGDL